MSKPFFRRFTKSFLITCNIIIAIFFLLGANVKYFNPQSWWFMGLFTLALPYILLTLIIFFIFWIFTRKIWMFISIITIAINWKAVQNIFPLHFSKDFKKEKKINSLRIMSWNVEVFNIGEYKTKPEVKVQMMNLINSYHPDIACFQEMVGGDDDKAINYLGDFKRILNFSEYYYSYDYRLDFDKVHHYGIIVFSKFPIINKQTISTPPHNYNSTFQYVDIIANNDTVRIFNIHLQSISLTQKNLEYIDNPITNTDTVLSESKNIIGKLKRGFLKRFAQSNIVKQQIDKSPYPVIICGDFNDVPNSYAYSKIGEGLQNVFVEKGIGFGRTFSGISPTLRIDNIFADKKFTIEQFIRIPQKLSAHFPLIADVSINKQNYLPLK
jgi:endonuclease/exonuclease/phosphatase family metal-dependent hydrolase